MIILPAIDIFDGKVVRLQKGDFNKMTVYSDNPAFFSNEFYSSGAKHLHVVDLEGAKNAALSNFKVIENIVKNTPLKVEVGGGIRSTDDIQKYIDIGVHHVIVGTKALEDRSFLEQICSRFGKRIALGIDILNRKIAVRGWKDIIDVDIFDYLNDIKDLEIDELICTDISKDGMLGGTNAELYKTLNSEFNVKLVASGGVSTIDDIRALKEIGTYGAIIGKSLYEKKIELSEAVEIGGDQNAY